MLHFKSTSRILCQSGIHELTQDISAVKINIFGKAAAWRTVRNFWRSGEMYVWPQNVCQVDIPELIKNSTDIYIYTKLIIFPYFEMFPIQRYLSIVEL